MPLPAALLTDLRALLGASALDDHGAPLEAYSHDETPGLPPRLPDAVARPTSADQVARILSSCHRAGVPVTPRGGGTGHSGGCVAARGGLVLDLSRLNKILEIDPGDMVAVVEPGVILQELHQTVEAQGLFYPPDPNSLESCTLGGNVAENAGGPRAIKYGVTRDYVLGLDLRLADGRPLRVGRRSPKGVSGYDLTALLVGSEGTLAVITAVTLRLLPLPREIATAWVSFASAEQAMAAVQAVMQTGVLPRTLEFMDDPSLRALRALTASSAVADGQAALLIETDGHDADAVLAELARAVEACEAAGARDSRVAQNPRQRRELWALRRRLTEATRHILGHKIAEDIAVPRKKIPEALARVYAIGTRHGLQTAAYGHAGDGNLHVQVLFADPERELSAVHLALDAIMAMCIELGGTLSGEHGIGLAKRRFMHLEHAPLALELMRGVKRLWDPKNLLNPGKIFDEA